MGALKTHEQFIMEMNSINPSLEILEEYKGTHKKTKFRCLKCGYEFIITPHQILSGVGCPHCRSRKRRTHQDFIEDVLAVNPDIEIISEFKNFQTKVRCRCLIDDHEWSALPQSLLNGHGCPKCAAVEASIRNLTPKDEFVKRVNELSPDVILLSDYESKQKRVKCKCRACGNVWETHGSNLLHGTGCPECANRAKGKYNMLTKEEFCDRLHNINDNVEVIGEYMGMYKPILCICKKDGTEWYGIPVNLLKGAQCPKCRCSIGERVIAEELDNYGIEYKPQHRFSDCKDVRTLPFDFYIPSSNLCIEFDGLQHFEPVNFGGRSYEESVRCLKITQEHDRIKTSYCKENKINLLRIRYDEVDSIKEKIQKIIS